MNIPSFEASRPLLFKESIQSRNNDRVPPRNSGSFAPAHRTNDFPARQQVAKESERKTKEKKVRFSDPLTQTRYIPARNKTESFTARKQGLSYRDFETPFSEWSSYRDSTHTSTPSDETHLASDEPSWLTSISFLLLGGIFLSGFNSKGSK